MKKEVTRGQIAYRCPECGVATVGFLGGLGNIADMLRLKCECGNFALDIKREKDGKARLTVPCVYCKNIHSYVVSQDILTREDVTCLSCPHSGQDILFIANEEKMPTELERSANELSRILASFDAEELSDIQPEDGDSDMAPDAGVYDVLNFLVRDLIDAGDLSCPCKKGPYSLRYCDEGAEVVCDSCGATYIFHAKSPAAAESYLSLDKIDLN